MNLESRIRPELWKEVRGNLDAARYTEVIKDAVYHLSEVLREKANLEGDGISLVGQALGGQSPKIKVTKLESQSDKDTQAGFEALLRGVYLHIRNPRAHEKYTDSEADCVAILLFINYLLSILQRSKAVFSLPDYMVQVFDQDFVADVKYADLLVAEIPEKFRFDVFVEVWRRRETGEGKNLILFLRALLSKLTEEQSIAAYELFSSDLRIDSSFTALQISMNVVEAAGWTRIHPIPRMRIEARILEEIRKGRFNIRSRKCESGTLATWAAALLPVMENRNLIVRELIYKLTAEDIQAADYVLQFFSIRELMPVPADWVVSRIKTALRTGNVRVKEYVENPFDEEDVWMKPFAVELGSFKACPAKTDVDEDIPF